MKTNSLSIQDLMIGDWVNISEFPLNPLPMQIRPRHFINDNLRFEAIPLTKDLFVKNGFEVWNDCAMFGKVEFYCNDDNEFYLSITMDEYRITQIHYLHELQHLFKLCGIEKEWVL